MSQESTRQSTRQAEEKVLTQAIERLLQISSDEHAPLTLEQRDRAYIVLAAEVSNWDFPEPKDSLATLSCAIPNPFLEVIEEIANSYS